jgi:hypothetical protein
MGRMDYLVPSISIAHPDKPEYFFHSLPVKKVCIQATSLVVSHLDQHISSRSVWAALKEAGLRDKKASASSDGKHIRKGMKHETYSRAMESCRDKH